MSPEIVDALLGVAIIVGIVLLLGLILIVKFIVDNYGRLNKESRQEALDREERLHGIIDDMNDSLRDVSSATERISENVSRSNKETSVAINAIEQTTRQLGNTVTTLTTTVDGLDRSMKHVIGKLHEQERKGAQQHNDTE